MSVMKTSELDKKQLSHPGDALSRDYGGGGDRTRVPSHPETSGLQAFRLADPNPEKRRPVRCPVCGHPVYRHAGLEKCYPRALDTKRRADQETTR